MSVTTWIGTLFQKIVSIFHSAEDVEKVIFTAADNFVNVVKNLETSQIGQFLETGIEAAFPQFAGLVGAIHLWLPKVAGLMAGVQGTIVSDEAKVEAFLAHLATLKANEPILYAGALNTLNAATQQLLATNTGVTSLTPPMSLASAQVVHDEKLGN